MNLLIIFHIVKKLWNEWNVRGTVLFSLSCQMLLILLASLRKRSERYSTHILTWFSYLMADWIAIYSIGIMLNIARNDCPEVHENHPPVAFWAPFLLLHLGGPDTITAFSLLDNQLWIRHLVHLLVEFVMVAYVFLKTNTNNDFQASTILVFLAGLINYCGRVHSLYLACLDNLKDSMRLTTPVLESGNSGVSVFISENLSEIQIVKQGYKLYNIFRGLIVDHMFTSNERELSMKMFIGLEPEEAFKVMEVELNFMHDELFTKMAPVYRGGYYYTVFFFRFTAFVSIMAAFLLFVFHQKVNKRDIAATYALFGGAIILEFVALIKILFSDWMIAILPQSLGLLVYSICKKMTFWQPRWSGCICQHNLISYCFKRRFKWLDATVDCFGLKSTFEEIRYKGHKRVDEGTLKVFIFEELHQQASILDEEYKEFFYMLPEMDWILHGRRHARKICSSRGQEAVDESVELSVSKDIEYDESVLVWHIATDLLYHTIDDHNKKEAIHDHRELCKRLSDYMLYLLIMRPGLMSAVAGVSQIRFRETCTQAMQFFDTTKPILCNQKEACKKLLTSELGDETPNSVLYDACSLAKKLRDINNRDDMWKMMSKVWLELLFYSANHCQSSGHAEQLNKGGELITFVWLLMAHLGLCPQLWMETRATKSERMGRRRGRIREK